MRALLALTLLLHAPVQVAAQAATTATEPAPEAVTLEFLQALKRSDWAAAVSYSDPVEMAAFANIFHRLAETPGAEQELAQIFNLKEGEQVAALPPAELVARMLAYSIGRNPETSAALKTAEYQVLGRVDEGSDQTHVVLRVTIRVQSAQVGTAEIRSLRHTAQGWRLQLPAEMKGMIAGFAAASGGEN